MRFRVFNRIFTAAIVLTIHIVFFTDFEAALKTVSLFKIARKKTRPTVHFQLCTDVVDFIRVFKRTDRKRRRKPIERVYARVFICALHTQFVASSAPLSAFGFGGKFGIFDYAYRLFEFALVAVRTHEPNAVFDRRRKLRQKSFEFVETPLVFLPRMNIRVVIINRDVEIRREIFDDVGRTRRTACMKKERRFCRKRFRRSICRNMLEDIVKFRLIISLHRFRL